MASTIGISLGRAKANRVAKALVLEATVNAEKYSPIMADNMHQRVMIKGVDI